MGMTIRLNSYCQGKSRDLFSLFPASGERVGVRGSWAGRGASAPHPTRSSRVDLSPPLAHCLSAEEGERAPHCPPIGVGVQLGGALSGVISAEEGERAPHCPPIATLACGSSEDDRVGYREPGCGPKP
jgi:hypothetical protein